MRTLKRLLHLIFRPANCKAIEKIMIQKAFEDDFGRENMKKGRSSFQGMKYF